MMQSAEDRITSNRDRIIELLRSTDREGIENVLAYLDESGYYTAPSSIRRHHNRPGGLAQHSLGVCLIALQQANGLPTDSIIICALLHDICKARKLYYDDRGNIRRNQVHIHGHGRRSVILLQKCGLPLTEEEYLAIRWHMGGHHTATEEEKEEVSRARASILWQLIHNADKKDASANK